MAVERDFDNMDLMCGHNGYNIHNLGIYRSLFLRKLIRWASKYEQMVNNQKDLSSYLLDLQSIFGL
jgi:hypothetical protein